MNLIVEKLKECIKLLSADGIGSKSIVQLKLENLLKSIKSGELK